MNDKDIFAIYMSFPFLSFSFLFFSFLFFSFRSCANDSCTYVTFSWCSQHGAESAFFSVKQADVNVDPPAVDVTLNTPNGRMRGVVSTYIHLCHRQWLCSPADAADAAKQEERGRG